MLLDLINRYALWIFAPCLVGIVAALVMVVRSYREGKTAPFSYTRDTAMVRAQRAMYVVILLFLVVVGVAATLALTSPPPTTVALVPPPSPTPSPVPTLMLSSATPIPPPPSPTPSPTPTLRPTVALTPTALPPSPTPTTPPPSPTPTPPPPSPTPTLLPPSSTPTTPPPSPTPTLEPVSTPTATAVPTSTPEMATATPTPAFSPTPAPLVETPTPTAAPALAAPAAPSGAAFGEITFSRSVSEDNQPLEPGTVFAAGSKPVYIFFEYRGLSKDVSWTQAWYREGEEMWQDTGPWQWGSRGRAWFFYTPPSGYTPGSYEVRLYIGDELRQTGMFVVQ